MEGEVAVVALDNIPFVRLKCPNCGKVRGEGYDGFNRFQCRPCNLSVSAHVDAGGNVTILEKEKLK